METQATLPQRKSSARSRGNAVRSPYTTEACQECRRRRSKCDGTRPLCGRCLRFGIKCKFTGRDDSRGTAPKSLMMLLQNRIEILEQVLSLHSIDIDSWIAKLSANLKTPHSTIGSLNDTAVSSAAQLQPQSTESDGALCSKEVFGLENDGEVSFFGSSSGRVELLQSNDQTSTAARSISPALPLPRRNQFRQEIESTLEVSEELQEHLLALYFEWEQPWFPLVDENLFRQSMKSSGRYFSPFLLNSLLAIGCRYSDRPEVRSVLDDPNTAGRMFLEIAEVLLHFDIQSPSITTVQSLGVLSMMYVATGSDSKAWLLHGMAVRLALDMGFNLNGSNLHKFHALPDEEVKLRKQIYWSLYCTDKLWASYTGRICTMLDSQASIELPLPVTAVQDPVPRREPFLVLFHALSTQCQILEKILMNLYAPKKLALATQRETFFDSCLFELKIWRYRLPSDMQIKLSGSNNTKITPHVYILHMVYRTSLIMLGKCFLPRRHKSQPKEVPFTQSRDQNYTNTTSERAVALCIEAAREICLLGEQYRKAFGSFRRSPVTVTHCTLSAILFFIFSLKHCKRDDRDKDYGPRTILKLVNSGIVTLGELATSWMPARHYWKALLAIVKDRQHSSDPQSPGCDNLNVAPSSPSSAIPDLTLEGINEPFWNNVLEDMRDGTEEFQSAEMWDSVGNYSFPDFEMNSLFDDLPHGLDLFSSEHQEAWFAN